MKTTTLVLNEYHDILEEMMKVGKFLYNETLYTVRQNYLNHKGSEKSDT